MRTLLPLALAALIVLPGCYHAKIETGQTPSMVQIDQPWALGFIYGLIPPPTVETMERCPNGVAMVETQLSFLNQVVSAITFGIVTPMHITVTCADGSAALDEDAEDIAIAPEADTEAVVEAFGDAADLAAESGEAVLVRFE
ncbi:MAG: hypothetical protein AAF845_09300 [Bacteroidota bacterium]